MSRGPDDMKPRVAWRRYVDHRRTEATTGTVKTYHYRLKQFVEWCEDQPIESVSELNGWDFETYQTARRGDGLAATTLAGEMQTLKNFIEYLERIELVEDGLAERVHIPNVDAAEQSSDKKLDTDQAQKLLNYYRNSDEDFGSRRHALFEVLWFTAARIGSIRALDLRDVYLDEQYIDFKHRPKTGTPLKNKSKGERPVGVPREVCEAIQAYIEGDRWRKRDDYARQPLFTTREGRGSLSALRCYTYTATLPCLFGPCPHGSERAACGFLEPYEASKCPSSRSPHQIRTGSITWQLDCGLPPEVVSKRVNASQRVIKRHYDKATALEEMENRRRPHLDRLELES
ncbi:tyrosine-type recombinase/integrase [Haloprofundus salinisoli]|uniref:tyrosine-type recombinase/integrase n=1 Tax=Haloprofundus salinisoli TaxID=2876193 RepID=UPI001CCD5C7F|nr:tyrosine-type recombinase/integrase [Haloprofundus salinisoli]